MTNVQFSVARYECENTRGLQLVKRVLSLFVLTSVWVTVGCSGCTEEVPFGEDTDTGADVSDVQDTVETDTTEIVETIEDTRENDSVENLAIEVQNTYCQKIFECCSKSERENELGMGDIDTVEECRKADNQLAQVFSFWRQDESVEAGRAVFDDSSAEVCMNSMKDAKCSDFSAEEGVFSENRPGCNQIIQPQLDEGEECQQDFECKTGWCKRKPDGEGGFHDDNKKCAVPPQAGDPCPNGKCGPGTYCSTFGTEFTCKSKAENGGECEDDKDCESGVCGTNDAGEEVCTEPQPLCTGK